MEIKTLEKAFELQNNQIELEAEIAWWRNSCANKRALKEFDGIADGTNISKDLFHSIKSQIINELETKLAKVKFDFEQL